MSDTDSGAPTRHPLDWRSAAFADPDEIDREMRRVFDICHGCRRCFNLCDSFPRLFDLIDESETGELDSVSSGGFAHVVEACTLCDMCFMTKCPYVPPHEFDLDFPHLMLRHRAARHGRGETPWVQRQLSETDRNGRLAGALPDLANWASARDNHLTRPLLEKAAHIDRRAELPKFHGKTFMRRAEEERPAVNLHAPARGRKAVIFGTCFVNYNDPPVGIAAQRLLAHLGVETETLYPACCGMPFLEHGDIAEVARRARVVADAFADKIAEGYEIVSLTASCSLMLKFEWPLVLPGDEAVARLAGATRDIDEYVVDIARKEGLADGMQPIEGGITVHLACHARAQNMGPKAAELLRLIPEAEVTVIERCSGHGGTFGILEGSHEVARKVGRPVVRTAAEAANRYLVSDCPLAAKHILQGMRESAAAGAGAGEEATGPIPDAPFHPVELMARAYGLVP